MRTFDIDVNASGTDGSIMIDGIEAKRFAKAFTVTARVGEITRLELELLCLPDGASITGAAYVGLAPHTEDLLIALGWTPPAMGNSAQEIVQKTAPYSTVDNSAQDSE